MATFLLVMSRKRKWLTGPLCLMAPSLWWWRRIFCLNKKPPPHVQAPSPTTALHPSATRSAVPHPLPMTKSLTLLPPVLPDLLFQPLFILNPNTRRRRTPALVPHAQPQGPKLADLLWIPNSLPLYSSSNGITQEGLELSAGKMLLWAFSTYNHKVSLSPFCSRWSTRRVKPQVSMASPDQLTSLLPFLPRGANLGSLSERG